METVKTNDISEIRIYVACLASYNNGVLHGRWIDATLGADHIWEEIEKVKRQGAISFDPPRYQLRSFQCLQGLDLFLNIRHYASSSEDMM